MNHKVLWRKCYVHGSRLALRADRLRHSLHCSPFPLRPRAAGEGRPGRVEGRQGAGSFPSWNLARWEVLEGARPFSCPATLGAANGAAASLYLPLGQMPGHKLGVSQEHPGHPDPSCRPHPPLQPPHLPRKAEASQAFFFLLLFNLLR